MKDKELYEAFLAFISLLLITTVMCVIICAFKYRDLANKYADLSVKCKRLETRQVKVINNIPDIPINVEPSDDEIVITVGQDIFKKGGD